VEVGKRADLLLLDGDPLQDVANTSRYAGVMVRGRWLDGDALRTATANPARFLDRSGEFGTVAIGRRADLLLLDANPLDNVANAAGMPTETTTTTYALVPGDTVQITEYVGHKVEVTGMLVPKGEMSAKTETKVDGDTTKKEEVKSESDMPQFRVISIRNLAERCE
jgi:imidazolonepropionase-like amidohydrolase